MAQWKEGQGERSTDPDDTGMTLSAPRKSTPMCLNVVVSANFRRTVPRNSPGSREAADSTATKGGTTSSMLDFDMAIDMKEGKRKGQQLSLVGIG